MMDGSPLRIGEVVDLLVVWAMVWAGVVWLRAAPARLALAGLASLAVFYLLARQLGLVLTTWILQGFVAAAVLIAVVVFQQDLRRLFEQIAAFGLRRRTPGAGLDAIDTLVRSIVNLAENHRGALLVLPGHEPFEGYIDGGLKLDAEITEPLLLSLFDPHSPGHDGAVVVGDNRLARFAAHLPLSTDHAQLGQRGTRHAAGLGLAERCDALCIIVSEERGTVSIAQAGRLRTLQQPQDVSLELRGFLRGLAPEENEARSRMYRFLHRWREGLVALPVAGLLWLLAVPGSTVIELDREVPVSVGGLPPAYELDTVEPAQVRVKLRGRRRDLLLLGPTALDVRVDAVLVDLGRRSFAVTSDNVRHPEGLEVRSIEPDRVRISIREREPSQAATEEAPR